MKQAEGLMKRSVNRRSFLKKGVVGAGTAALAAGLHPESLAAFGREEDDGAPITKGDIAILTFLSALEQVEADLWIQYAELGGPTRKVPGAQGLSGIDLELNGKSIATGLAADYVIALRVLDGDMPQYIADNTDDEISHHQFLNNYLASKGAKTIDLSEFAILPPSRVTDVPQNGRLTNLKHLTVDTTWWTRYRSDTKNPDLGRDSMAPRFSSHRYAWRTVEMLTPSRRLSQRIDGTRSPARSNPPPICPSRDRASFK